MRWKHDITTTELCSGLPIEFHMFLSYTWQLSFDAEPDYNYIRTLFHNLFIRKGYYDNRVFDWGELSGNMSVAVMIRTWTRGGMIVCRGLEHSAVNNVRISGGLGKHHSYSGT